MNPTKIVIAVSILSLIIGLSLVFLFDYLGGFESMEKVAEKAYDIGTILLNMTDKWIEQHKQGSTP